MFGCALLMFVNPREKSKVSNTRLFINFEATHLIFWILSPLLYLSRIVVQPDLENCSTTDIQGGAESVPHPPTPDLTRKNRLDLIGLNDVSLKKILLFSFCFSVLIF